MTSVDRMQRQKFVSRGADAGCRSVAADDRLGVYCIGAVTALGRSCPLRHQDPVLT
jgi:hypothetical protein